MIDYNRYREELFQAAENLRNSFVDYDPWVNLTNPTKTFSDASSLLDATTNTTLAAAIAIDDSKVLAQGDIIITARFLNVNGLIQSGSDKIEFHVDNDFVAPTATTNFLDASGKQQLPGISYGAAGVPVKGYWDAARQAFVIEEIKPEGGRIRIAGQILIQATDD